MPYITSVEEIGFERGLQQGQSALVVYQLTRRLGELPPTLTTQIKALAPTQLESLAIALLDFTQVTELENWLAQQESVTTPD